jgi:hypothetical protein
MERQGRAGHIAVGSLLKSFFTSVKEPSVVSEAVTLHSTRVFKQTILVLVYYVL